MIRGLLEALFPPACAACGADVEGHDTLLCPPCATTLVTVEPPVCAVCGVPFGAEVGGERACARCASEPPAFSAARAFAQYGGELETLLLALKFGGRRDLARPLGRLAAATFAAWLGAAAVDLVAPVPLSRRRLRERGYDQAWLLAREVALRLGRPAEARALVRARETAPQTALSAARRRDNVASAFAPGRPDVAGRRVLLVDDVLTTGATASACARTLRAAGASEVVVLTVARAA